MIFKLPTTLLPAANLEVSLLLATIVIKLTRKSSKITLLTQAMALELISTQIAHQAHTQSATRVVTSLATRISCNVSQLIIPQER